MNVLRNYVREYLEIIARIKRIPTVFNTVKPYLIRGIYLYNSNGTKIQSQSAPSKKELVIFSDTETYGNPLIFIRELLVSKKVLVNQNNGSFAGKNVIISSSGCEYKIFSDTAVLTIYTNRRIMDNIIYGREFFQEFFPVPKILQLSKEKGIIIEEKIEHIDFNLEDAITHIFNQYATYAKNSVKYKMHKINFSPDNFRKKFHVEPGKNIVDSVCAITVHGDLWKSNIIFQGSKYYLIDFENVSTRYFLYDFFMLIYTEYFQYANDIYMINYFSGKYDSLLIRLFASVDCEYHKEKKFDYFLIYLISIYNERWANSKSYLINKRLKKTIKVFYRR